MLVLNVFAHLFVLFLLFWTFSRSVLVLLSSAGRGGIRRVGRLRRRG